MFFKLNIIYEALRYLKEEGIKAFLIRAVKEILSPFFKIRKEIFYEKDLSTYIPEISPKLNATFREGSLMDLLKLKDKMYLDINTIKRWIISGKKVFIVEAHNEVIHYSWLSFDEEYIKPIEKKITLAKNEGFIHTCRTMPSFRKKRIYSFVLSNICKYLRSNGYSKVLICANSKNIPSIKSIQKMGFKRIGEVFFLKLFLFKKYKYSDKDSFLINRLS